MSSDELAQIFYQNEHISCINYKTSLDFGFKYVEFAKGEKLESRMMPRHNIIMVIEGEIKLNCDKYEPLTLCDNQMVLIPKSAFFDASIVKQTKIVIFGFEVPIGDCDKTRLESYAPLCEKIDYDFHATPIKPPVRMMLDLTIYYLKSGINCVHMHESKHRELFMCLKSFYSKQDIAYLFHPLIGRKIDFRSLILQHSDKFNSTSDMINLTNMSRTLFYKIFKECFGTTAKQWMLKHKIQKMRFAAARPNITVKELMVELDFGSSAQLTQFCKQHCNCTPSELIDSLRHQKKS